MPETTTTQPQMPQGAKQQVRFYDRVKQRKVESLLDEDHSLLWYSSKDYLAARDKEKKLRCYVRKTEKTEGNLNAQGILTSDEFTRKRIAVIRAKVAVLEEQETQELEYTARCGRKAERPDFAVDDEQIAKAYYPYSQAALAEAQHRALTHEMHIQAILSDPTEELISAFPMRRPLPKELDSPVSQPRRKSRLSLLRPGRRFSRPTVSTPAA